MAFDIINSTLAQYVIEYNGYRFNPKCRSRLSVDVKKDGSGRTEVAKVFTLKVSGYITPRRPIPGDDDAIGIQLPAPWPQVPVPGYDPKHVFATTDSEIKIILEKLLETGKTLRYCGIGMGDLYVNTVDPNTGLYVPDLNFGPHTKINSLYTAGFNKCWYIDWEAIITVPVCRDIDYNNVGNRIQEFIYAVNYNIDKDGFARRTLSGKLTIIPPMYRSKGNILPRQGAFVTPGTGNKNLQDAQIQYVVYNNKINDIKTDINNISTSVDTNLTQINNILTANGITLNIVSLYGFDRAAVLNYLTVNYVTPGTLNAADANTITGLVLTITGLLNRYNANSIELTNAYINRQEQQDIISSQQATVSDMAKYPESISKIIPNGAVPVDLTFGPLNIDNVGNTQNYETADQYRELLRTAFPIPFNFERLTQDYRISEDRRTLSFSIVDQERPSFSFIPGYSTCKISQSTESTETGFKEWQSTLSASFKMPKFIHSRDDGINGYGDKVSNDLTNKKIVPKKLTAFADFIKIAFQRFALSLLTPNSINRSTVVLPDGSIQERILNVRTLYPTKLSISENVLANEISFTLTYFIICDLWDLWFHTGHGLPCILAADMSLAAAKNITKNVVLNKTVQNQQWALAVFFDSYSDILKHGDWLSSQRYAGVNTRGTSNLIFDRTYDRPNINTCTNPVRAEDVLPIHLDSASPLAGMGNKTRQSLYVTNTDTTSPINNLLNELDAINPCGHIVAEKIREALAKKTSVKLATELGRQERYLQLILENAFTARGNFIDERNAIQDKVNEIAIYLEGHGGLTSSIDSDLLLSNDFSVGAAPDTLELPLNLGATGLVDFDNNISFNQNVDTTASFFNPIDAIATNRLFLAALPPTPEGSWIAYESEIELVTDNTIVRHKLMPKKDLSPVDNYPNDASILESNFMETIPSGQDNVVGNSINDFAFQSADVEDDVIQYMGSPSNLVILRGYGIRMAYEVVSPTLLKYGTLKTYQLHRRVRQKILGKGPFEVYGCEWEIIYVLANTPSGYLPTPENPIYSNINDSIDSDTGISDNLGDVYLLEESEQIND